MAIFRTVSLAMYCDKCKQMLAHLNGPETQLEAMVRTVVTCKACIVAPNEGATDGI